MKRALPLLPALLLLAASCRQEDPAAAPDPGRAYYAALNCRVCHRVGPEGGRGGPDLSLVGFRHNREWLDLFLKDPQAWKKGTLMPNPRLSDEARAALAGYLASLKGQDFGPTRPWQGPADALERGRVLYARAGCIACHGQGGQGGFPNNNVRGGIIPPLKGLSERYSRAELAAKIRKGVRPEKADPRGPEPLVVMPAWGEKLSEAELDDAVTYLLSLKGGESAAGW